MNFAQLVLEDYLTESIQTKTKTYQKCSKNNVSGVVNTMGYHHRVGILVGSKDPYPLQILKNFRGTFLKDPRGF